MLWSDKAFKIYLGMAGDGVAPGGGDSSMDGLAPTRTPATTEDCDETDTPQRGGWLARAASALANRAALTRIARG